MISKKFIAKVSYCFNALGYFCEDCIDYDKFVSSAVYTLTRTNELYYVIYGINLFNYCIDNWHKIEEISKYHFDTFCEYGFYEDDVLKKAAPKTTKGTYIIACGLELDKNKTYITMLDKQKWLALKQNGKAYEVFSAGKYALYESCKQVDVLTKKGALLCEISEKWGEFYFAHNHTQYDFVDFDGFWGVYSKSYLEQVKDDDDIDFNQAVATINSSYDHKAGIAVARLRIKDENQDIEQIVGFAAAMAILRKQEAKRQKRFDSFLQGMVIGSRSAAYHRRFR